LDFVWEENLGFYGDGFLGSSYGLYWMDFSECDSVYAFGLKLKMEGDFSSVGRIMCAS
jgi:hypothetical protein